jgi:DNA-binding IclR family transcriptional regulator
LPCREREASIASIASIIKCHGMPRITSAILGKFTDLMNDLELSGHQGYATDSGELERGLERIAAPIFVRDSDLVAALGIAGPTGRLLGEELSKKIAA